MITRAARLLRQAGIPFDELTDGGLAVEGGYVLREMPDDREPRLHLRSVLADGRETSITSQKARKLGAVVEYLQVLRQAAER